MTETGKAAYPLVADNARALRKLLRAALQRCTKPAWRGMISRNLQPSRAGEEEAAAKTGPATIIRV